MSTLSRAYTTLGFSGLKGKTATKPNELGAQDKMKKLSSIAGDGRRSTALIAKSRL